MRELTGKGNPFHSALDKAAGLLKRKVGTGAEFMQELKALGGVKQSEIEGRKLGELLGMPKMTHEQFMAELGNRPLPAIGETVFGEKPSKEDIIREANSDIRHYAGEYAGDKAETSKEYRSLMAQEARRLRGKHRGEITRSATEYLTKPTHHEDYTLPGGENYREMLIKAPKRDRYWAQKYGGEKMYFDDPDKASNHAGSTGQAGRVDDEDQVFQGIRQHFGGEPGILASMRLKDRLIPDTEGPHNVKVIGGGGYTTVKHPTREAAEQFAAVKHQGGYKTEITPTQFKKILHLEELQSDWHQKGRKHGYQGVGSTEGWKVISNDVDDPNQIAIVDKNGKQVWSGINRYGTDSQVIRNVARELEADKVPDSPVRGNWEEMALKRLLHHAAEKGYHGIAVTPGREQADRYSLAKHIDRVELEPNTLPNKGTHPYYFLAYDKNGRRVADDTANESKLHEYLGQDVATKLLNAEPVGERNARILNNADLSVGGEGMKGFYDKKVPNILNTIGKKYGVKTELRGMPINSMMRNKVADLHHFPITENMRQDILTNGLPLYAEGGIIHKAEGGNVQPSVAQMKMALAKHGTPIDLKNIGVNEAPNMTPKMFFAPDQAKSAMPAPGGVATPSGMPIGGIDVNQQQGGQQLMPQTLMQPQQAAQPPQGGQPQGPQGPTPPMGNMLQMTPQGQALGAMRGEPAPQGKPMAKGGSLSVDDMKAELAQKKAKKAKAPVEEGKRMLIEGEGKGGVKGIVVPRHMWHGKQGVYKKGAKKGEKFNIEGMSEINKARAKVYGAENRDPLTIGQIGKIHKDTLAEHFAKPLEEQHKAEQEALDRLRAAKHIGHDSNTLDESEKLDTVRHETDDKGRTHVGFASKGVAGHALYTSGYGQHQKHHIVNTCPGQTVGCGGGMDENGIVDTKKGTCFAPNAESQYVHAAIRRASHEQAKHDPAMTRDWILAHTGSLRDAARLADKKNQRLLFRPNVVDETDTSSRHVLRHLNDQRKAENKPDIIANSYGKTNELHDPENGYYVTHSNVGPKVKKGQSIAENISRDKARVRNTVMAADNKGDFTNEQGNKTPPKGSYLVTDVKRGSQLSKDMEGAIKHAKYWSTGRHEDELSEEEKAEGPEGHFGANGKRTTPEKAHFGHTTVNGRRYDYQKQHILHPRLVQVGNNDDGTPHMIPTDSRFMDTKFLPEKRFMTKNGKEAGHILMTTPTESTDTLGHETSFTHHVNRKHVEHALKNKGEYEIDSPQEQEKAMGKEYVPPQKVSVPKTWKMADGGSISFGRHHGFGHDDFHAFPEQNIVAQRHLSMRRGEDEAQAKYHSAHKKGVKVHKDMDTMRLELTKKAK